MMNEVMDISAFGARADLVTGADARLSG